MLTPANIVRVDLTRLDDLMRMIGDLVVSRARLEDNLGRLPSGVPADQWRLLQETSQAMERQLRRLREGVMRVRMVPIGEVFTRMQFVVRDLAHESGKKVALALSGQETEVDKYVVERMMDPLLHLIRNAVSHGLEPPEERLARGKPAESTITLRATTSGETVVLEVEDDGLGIDPERIARRAAELGLGGGGSGPLGMPALLALLCTPGFSIRERADRASGRGVGLDVVKSAVQELGGSLTLTTRPGHGACFTVRLPLTLAITDALTVQVGTQTFAVPQGAVLEVLELQAGQVTVLENNEILSFRGGALPLLRLANLFALEDTGDGRRHVLVVGSGGNRAALVVDRVLGLREVVVRALTDPLVKSPGLAGATELGDGRVVLILDVAGLLRAARQVGQTKLSHLPGSASRRDRRTGTI